MINLPLCTSPVVIFNRSAVNAILFSMHYVIRGQHFFIDHVEHYRYATDFPYYKFNPIARTFYSNGKDGSDGLKLKDMEDCYTINSTGVKVNLFIPVPCNHCDLCQERRVSDFNTRAIMEGSVSNSLPIMLTLTYDRYHLPFEMGSKVDVQDLTNPAFTHDYTLYDKIGSPYLRFRKNSLFKDYEFRPDSTYIVSSNTTVAFNFNVKNATFRPCLDVRDTQKFLKRLRRFWEINDIHPRFYRDGKPCSSYAEFAEKYPLRYVICGEMGKNFNRPHYHAILFNVPYDIYNADTDFCNVRLLRHAVVKNWQCATPLWDWSSRQWFSDYVQCEIAKDCGAYVGKYVGKSVGSQRNTFQASNRGGGIGSAVIDAQKQWFLENPLEQTIKFKDRNGSVLEKKLGRYAHHRLFPSLSQLIPNEYVKTQRFAVNILSDVNGTYSYYGADNFDDLQSLIQDYSCSYLPYYLGIPTSATHRFKTNDYDYIDDGKKIVCLYAPKSTVAYPYFDEIMEDDLMFCSIKEKYCLDILSECATLYPLDYSAIDNQLSANKLHASIPQEYRSVQEVRNATAKAHERAEENKMRLIF